MLFSKRKKVTELAEEWCKKNNAPLNSFNIVTALNALGFLCNEAVEPGVPLTTHADDKPTEVPNAHN